MVFIITERMLQVLTEGVTCSQRTRTARAMASVQCWIRQCGGLLGDAAGERDFGCSYMESAAAAAVRGPDVSLGSR